MTTREAYKLKIKAALAEVYAETYSHQALRTLDDAMIDAQTELFHERAAVLKEAGDWNPPLEKRIE